MPHLHIQLLGAPEVRLDGNPIKIKRRKDLALLAYLAVTSQTHRREALAALFWPEHDSSRAFSNLRRSIWELKQITGDELLVTERDSVYLQHTPELWLDVAEFRAKLKEPGSVTEAIDLYQGDFMTGLTLPDSPDFDDWQYFIRDELHRALGSALESQAIELGGSGEFERAISYAQRWLSLDVLNEAAHRMLMTLYTWSGERATAMRQYQECERILEEELGLPPDEDTVRLYERIQSGEVVKKQIKEEGLPTPATNLPILPTPFVGRRLDLDQLHALLDDPSCRLLTLLGPGGVGKTRVAIQAADESQENFPNGVYFVALAGLDNPQSILPAIASVLKFPITAEAASPQDQLMNYLHRKNLLLVLDNFEHLVGGATIVAEIIARSTEVKILITSREKLGLQGEWIYEVRGMHYPEESAMLKKKIEDYSALQLFTQSARRAQADFRINADNMQSVVQITRLVRGMPLALELAAAWIPLLSSQEIAREIERSLDFLETNMQDVPERQRSMRAVFDHTWNLLDKQEREKFSRLSVFRGGFTLQAAGDIFDISASEIRGMIGKSLLQRSTESHFDLHELLRTYAAEKLSLHEVNYLDAQDKHCAYFSQAMHRWGQSIYTQRQQQKILVEINADFDNALAAWNWAVAQENLKRLDQALEGFGSFLWKQVRATEGISLFNKARHELADCSTPEACHMHARLLAWEGTFQRVQHNYKTAEHLFRESLSILENPEIDQEAAGETRALAHWGLGFNAFQIGDTETSKTHYEICLKLYQESGQPYYEAEVLADMARITAYLIWDAQGSEEYWVKAKEIKRELGDLIGVAGILYEQGIIAAYHIGDIEKALTLFQESSDIYAQFNDHASIAFKTRCKAQIAHLTSRYAENLELWQSQIPIFEDMGNHIDTGWTHTNLALTYNSLGDYSQSEVHIREALKILETTPEEDIQKGINRWSLGKVLVATGRLSEAMAVIEKSLQIDRQMTGKHNLGRDLSALSLVEFLMGNKDSAWKHVLEAIELFLQYQHFDWMIYAASTAAIHLADQGATERALTLYGMITRYPEAATSQWFEDVYWCHIHQAAAKLTSDEVEAAIDRGRQVDLWEYLQELLNSSR